MTFSARQRTDLTHSDSRYGCQYVNRVVTKVAPWFRIGKRAGPAKRLRQLVRRGRHESPASAILPQPLNGVSSSDAQPRVLPYSKPKVEKCYPLRLHRTATANPGST